MLADLVQPFNDAITSLSLALPRVMVCFLIVPALSNRFVHGMLKTAVSVGICIPAAVGIYYQTQIVEVTAWSLIGFFMKEAVLGILIGVLLALPFWLFESIGTLFDTQRGALMGEQLNPETGSMTSITGLLMLQSVIVLMIELGAFAWMFGFIVNSYVLWPALEWLPVFTNESGEIMASQFSDMALHFVLYALPVLMSLLIVELLFGLVSLYSPQLQVYFLAMPIKSLLGLCIFILMAGNLWLYAQDEMLQMKETHLLLELMIEPFIEIK